MRSITSHVFIDKFILPMVTLERGIRGVTGRPLITDGELDTAIFGTTLLNFSAFGLSAAAFLAKVELSQEDHDRLMGELRLFAILDFGVTAVGVIDLANGAFCPDEGADFLSAAQLVEGAGAELAAAGPDAGQWGGPAAQSYAERTTAAWSNLDELVALDKQMAGFMARQAQAVQKAHMTVAGGMNFLVMCYPIALRLFLSLGYKASYAFQVAAVSAVLGGVSTIEYLTAQESAEVGRHVDRIAEQYQHLFTSSPGPVQGAGTQVSETSAGKTSIAEFRSQGLSYSPPLPSVAELAAQADDGRAQHVNSMMNMLAGRPTPGVDPTADSHRATEVASASAPPTANRVQPAGTGGPAPSGTPSRSRRSGTGSDAAGARADHATAEAIDKATPPGSDGSDTAAGPGAHRTGAAPVGRPAAQLQTGDEPTSLPGA